MAIDNFTSERIPSESVDGEIAPAACLAKGEGAVHGDFKSTMSWSNLGIAASQRDIHLPATATNLKDAETLSNILDAKVHHLAQLPKLGL